MKGWIPVSKNKNDTDKNRKKMPAVAQPTREENTPNDPPGVHMPSEREMTPPQFG